MNEIKMIMTSIDRNIWIIALVFVIFIMITGRMHYKFLENGDIVFIPTYWFKYKIEQKNIQTIEWIEHEKIDIRICGLQNMKIFAGLFWNKELGKFRKYGYMSCKNFIKIKLKNDEIILINGKTEEETNIIFKKLVNF